MYPRVCRCCGEEILARAANPNICMDCERLMEDESPIRAAEAAAEQPKEPTRLNPKEFVSHPV
jgi:hypothetical protein